MGELRERSQAELIRLIAEGSEEAFAVVFHRYRNKIYTVALHYLKADPLAEEAVQDIFMRVWTYRDRLEGVVNFEAFLFILARNVLLNHLKKQAKEFSRESSSTAEPFPEKSADSRLVDAQNAYLLKRAIKNLPAQQRKVFELAREEDLSYKEIGEILQISPLTVKKHMAEAMKSLRNQLQDHLKVLFFLFLNFF